MRYEIYRYRDGEYTYLYEGDDGQEIVEMVYALSEQKKGQIIVIDNATAAVPGMSMPALKCAMGKQQTYELLLACKFARLLELERRIRGEALEEDFTEQYDALQERAGQETERLLGWSGKQRQRKRDMLSE